MDGGGRGAFIMSDVGRSWLFGSLMFFFHPIPGAWTPGFNSLLPVHYRRESKIKFMKTI